MAIDIDITLLKYLYLYVYSACRPTTIVSAYRSTKLRLLYCKFGWRKLKLENRREGATKNYGHKRRTLGAVAPPVNPAAPVSWLSTWYDSRFESRRFDHHHWTFSHRPPAVRLINCDWCPSFSPVKYEPLTSSADRKSSTEIVFRYLSVRTGITRTHMPVPIRPPNMKFASCSVRKLLTLHHSLSLVPSH